MRIPSQSQLTRTRNPGRAGWRPRGRRESWPSAAPPDDGQRLDRLGICNGGRKTDCDRSDPLRRVHTLYMVSQCVLLYHAGTGATQLRQQYLPTDQKVGVRIPPSAPTPAGWSHSFPNWVRPGRSEADAEVRFMSSSRSFASFLMCQLGANTPGEVRHVVLDDSPHDIKVDVKVTVDDSVSKSRHALPRYVSVRSLKALESRWVDSAIVCRRKIVASRRLSSSARSRLVRPPMVRSIRLAASSIWVR